MMQTVIGLFDTYEDAERAVTGLEEAGFVNQRLSIVARDASVRERLDRGSEAKQDILETTGKSALGGSVAGGLAGLLVGLGVLLIPGIGPVVAAGSLATTLGATLTGAGVGAAAGGMIGALAALGIDEKEAEAYAEGVKRGGIVVMVESEPERAEIARTVLSQANAVDVDQRRAQWVEDGWTHFDEQVIPPDQFPGGISTR